MQNVPQYAHFQNHNILILLYLYFHNRPFTPTTPVRIRLGTPLTKSRVSELFWNPFLFLFLYFSTHISTLYCYFYRKSPFTRVSDSTGNISRTSLSILTFPTTVILFLVKKNNDWLRKMFRPSFTAQINTDGQVGVVFVDRVNMNQNQFSYIPGSDTLSVN